VFVIRGNQIIAAKELENILMAAEPTDCATGGGMKAIP
jgi:hypothetical protein